MLHVVLNIKELTVDNKKPTSLFNRGPLPSNLLRPAGSKEAENVANVDTGVNPDLPPVIKAVASETPSEAASEKAATSVVADSDPVKSVEAGAPSRAMFSKKPRKQESAKPVPAAVPDSAPLPMARDEDLDAGSVHAMHEQAEKDADKADLTEDVPSAKKAAINFGQYIEKAASLFKASSFLKPKNLVLMTEISSLGTVAFHVTENSIQEVAVDSATALLSFTPKDYRYHSDSPLKSADADSLVLSELGVRAYFLTKKVGDTHVVYASPSARIESYRQAVCPGLSILEEALESKMTDTTKDYVIGTYLTDDSGKSLLMMYYKNKLSQRFTEVSVAANPSNVPFLINQFCATAGVSPSECEIYLLDNKQLLSAVKAHWLAYPHEDEIYGLSVRKLSMAGLGIVGALSLCSIGYTGYLYTSLISLKNEEASVAQQISTEKQNINSLLSGSVTSFAKTQNLDVSTVFKRAEQFWLPTSTVTVESTIDSETYRVQLMMVKQKLPVEGSPYQQLLMMKAPEGCMKDSISYLGAMNGVQVTIKCQNPISPLSGYRIG